jgi:hypothetical protein
VQLSTQALMAPDPREDPLNTPLELGWPEVRSGLNRILLGYLVTVFAVALVILGVWYIASLALAGRIADAVIDAGMLIFFGMGLMVLLGLLSVLLVITGKVRCLINVPERAGAKWMMFCSILCFLISPALNFAARFVPTTVSPEKVEALLRKHNDLFEGKLPQGKPGSKKGAKSDPAMDLITEIRDLVVSVAFLDSKAYVALGGAIAGVLHTIFFVLFLRAVATCFDDTPRRLFAEFYLGFTLLLIGSCVYLFFDPPRRLADLGFILLVLAAGWLFNLLWYLLLIVSASMGIASGLAVRQLDQMLLRN